MNDADPATNSGKSNERQLKQHQRTAVAASAISQDIGILAFRDHRASSCWIAAGMIVALWVLAFLVFTAERLMTAPSGQGWWFIVPRAISCAAGAFISFGILVTQRRLRDYGLTTRALAALALALAGTAVLAALNYPIVLPFWPKDQPLAPVWLAYSIDFLNRLWIFGSISGSILALSYLTDVYEREEKINALQALAHSAQVRALRNQLNPHFLFNALNSIAGLIADDRRRDAESMTENLADFLRLSLHLDPQGLITLSEELHLQELYLSIEQIRFPDRLRVSVAVPEELHEALVPSLITQPLVENSIKYALAQSTETVDLRIAAISSDDCLKLVIEDSGGNAPPTRITGGRLGLRNVAERLAAHFGGDAKLEASPRAQGGFRNLIVMPLLVA